MSDFRAIGDRSALGSGKDHQRSGLGERAYVPTLPLKKKDGGGSMCAKKEKERKKIPGFVFNRGARCCGGVHQVDKVEIRRVY